MNDRLDELENRINAITDSLEIPDNYKVCLLLILEELRMLRGQNDRSERMEDAVVKAFHGH